MLTVKSNLEYGQQNVRNVGVNKSSARLAFWKRVTHRRIIRLPVGVYGKDYGFSFILLLAIWVTKTNSVEGKWMCLGLSIGQQILNVDILKILWLQV